MAKGIPLSDEDRDPWLRRIRAEGERVYQEEGTDGRGLVVACSALKRSYRDILRNTQVVESSSSSIGPSLEVKHPSTHPEDTLRTLFVYMKGTRDVLMDRMEKRKGHFMKASMLNSQLATLEDPEGEEGVYVVNMDEETGKQIADVIAGFVRL